MILLSCLAILLPLSWCVPLSVFVARLSTNLRGGSSFNWQSAAVIVPLILGCFFVGVLLLVEAKYATLPNIPCKWISPLPIVYSNNRTVSMFRITTVTGVLIANFASGIAYFSALYFVSTQLLLIVCF